MSLTWLNNGFICKDLYAPFVLEKDSEYEKDLKKKYKTVIKQAKNASADAESVTDGVFCREIAGAFCRKN